MCDNGKPFAVNRSDIVVECVELFGRLCEIVGIMPYPLGNLRNRVGLCGKSLELCRIYCDIVWELFGIV